jgi:hypothetical protein
MHSVVDDAINLYLKVKVIKSEAASSLYYHNECLHRRIHHSLIEEEQ